MNVFLDFPKIENGQIHGVYPSKRFSKLVSEVNKFETSLMKLVGIVGVIDAVITHIENSKLGTDVRVHTRSKLKKKNGNASGELTQFEAKLVQFRNDRNCLAHAYLWKDDNGDDWRRILDRNQRFLKDLFDYFFVAQPSDVPGQITVRFPQLYEQTKSVDAETSSLSTGGSEGASHESR